jgi:hypothetical protein
MSLLGGCGGNGHVRVGSGVADGVRTESTAEHEQRFSRMAAELKGASEPGTVAMIPFLLELLVPAGGKWLTIAAVEAYSRRTDQFSGRGCVGIWAGGLGPIDERRRSALRERVWFVGEQFQTCVPAVHGAPHRVKMTARDNRGGRANQGEERRIVKNENSAL